MRYLSYLSYVAPLVYAESLYRHSFVVIDAFPYITKAAIGDGIFSGPDELFGNDVRGW